MKPCLLFSFRMQIKWFTVFLVGTLILQPSLLSKASTIDSQKTLPTSWKIMINVTHIINVMIKIKQLIFHRYSDASCKLSSNRTVLLKWHRLTTSCRGSFIYACTILSFCYCHRFVNYPYYHAPLNLRLNVKMQMHNAPFLSEMKKIGIKLTGFLALLLFSIVEWGYLSKQLLNSLWTHVLASLLSIFLSNGQVQKERTCSPRLAKPHGLNISIMMEAVSCGRGLWLRDR